MIPTAAVTSRQQALRSDEFIGSSVRYARLGFVEKKVSLSRLDVA